MARFDGVIFDMDGTLIEPLLDFAALRAELGIAPGEGILEAIAKMGGDRGRRCAETLLSRELAAARAARLAPGAAEALAAVRRSGLKTALLTRNAKAAMDIVLERLGELHFDLAWSREAGPIKPEPDGILRACRALRIAPRRTACVGDFRYDVVAANAAGAVSILVVRGERPDFADQADCVIGSLHELPEVLGV